MECRNLLWVQGEVRLEVGSCVQMIVVVHLAHVVGGVADLDVQASIHHGLSLNPLPPR